MTKLVAILMRDLRLALRAGGGAGNTVVFFALTIVIFALAVGPDRAQLSANAAAILWTAATLAAMLSFDRIFQSDFEDGSLDTLIETTDMVSLVALTKAAAHWLTTLAPLILAAPVLGLLLGLPEAAYWPLILSLLVGTPALSLLGAFASALALSLRRASLLMTILTAPLLTPALIFGVGAAKAGALGDPLYQPAMMILAAVSLLSCVVLPLAAAAAIRFNTE
jgi:heme exporter protein B